MALTTVMYHYVRPIKGSKYPEIKGLEVKEFIEQLDYFSRHYEFVTAKSCIDAIYNNEVLPRNALLLTFDDGYLDHYQYVFPILLKRGISGCFFPSVAPMREHIVLDVNKIHFILASIDLFHIINDISYSIDSYKHVYKLRDFSWYWKKISSESNIETSRFDRKKVVIVKTLLQRGLPLKFRKVLINQLFQRYVSENEKSFSKKLYFSIGYMQEMVRNGMYIGFHGYDHRWMNYLDRESQVKDVDRAIKFFQSYSVWNRNEWIASYPYGVHNKALVELLKVRGCKLGFTTNTDITVLPAKNPLLLSRLDTNDFPRNGNTSPNLWTKEVMSVGQQH